MNTNVTRIADTHTHHNAAHHAHRTTTALAVALSLSLVAAAGCKPAWRSCVLPEPLEPRLVSTTPEYHHVVSLGDSLLEAEFPGRRPVVSTIIAARMGVPLTRLAEGGSTSAWLLFTGQHTRAAEQFGPGDLAIVWISGNDFLANTAAIALGDYTFMDDVENNVETALRTVREAGIDVVVLSEPDFSVVPLLQTTIPEAALPNFAEVSLLWRNRLAALAGKYDAAFVDIYTFTRKINCGLIAATIDGRDLVPPPRNAPRDFCPMCFFHDAVHPSGLAQGLAANEVITVMNQSFAAFRDNPLPLLADEELLELGPNWDPAMYPAD